MKDYSRLCAGREISCPSECVGESRAEGSNPGQIASEKISEKD